MALTQNLLPNLKYKINAAHIRYMKVLRRHVGILLISFRTNLLKANHDADMDDIHNLRLDLKQLFALFKVLKLCNIEPPINFKESLEAVKALFKQTGIIRDNQLAKEYGQQILDYKVHKILKTKTDKNIQKARDYIATELQRIDLEKVERDLALAFKETDYLKSEYILDHLKNKIQKDENSIAEELQQEDCDYHRIRRKVKEQFYLLTVIKDVLGEKVSSQTIAMKNQQAKTLGKWHDWVVFENLLLQWNIALDVTMKKEIQSSSSKILNATFKKSLQT